MDTLVLSAAYEPMERVSWQRAMTLWITGRVEVVEEYEDRYVRTVSVRFNMPSVVRFVSALRRRKKGVKFSRENVYARDKGRCQYCGERVPRHAATYDHVVPRSRGGTTRWENIVIACMPCNQLKGCRTPEQAGMPLMVEPVKPRSLPDFWKVCITYDKSMPTTWRQYLTDMSYWYGELASDE